MIKYNSKNTNYIYRSKNNRLVLHDFLYDMFYKYESAGITDITDSVMELINKIIDRIHIWQLYNNEFTSQTLDYYAGLYKFIEQNGGIKNCERLTDYTYNINNLNGIKELVQSGVITKEEVKIENKELIIPVIKEQPSSKKASITVYNIIRNSKGYLILPDEVFNAYNSFDGDDAGKFANFIINRMSEQIRDITEDLYKYYASIFKLIEKEKYCVIISDFCKNNPDGDNTEYIKSMLLAGKAKMYKISYAANGTILESQTGEITEIENSAYNCHNSKKTIDKKEEEHKLYIKTQLKEIEDELKNISNNLKIKTEDSYKTNINRINSAKMKVQNIYEYSQHKFELKEIHDNNILIYTENKHKDIILEIEKLEERINNFYSDIKKQQKISNKNKEKIDYYEQIKAELTKFSDELNAITQNMIINSDKDYISMHSKLSALKDKLHKFYNKSLKEAHKNNGLTGHIIKEATSKHNELIKKIDEQFKDLETQKKKLLFKNVFKG